MQQLQYPLRKTSTAGWHLGFSQYFGSFNSQVDWVMLDGKDVLSLKRRQP